MRLCGFLYVRVMGAGTPVAAELVGAIVIAADLHSSQKADDKKKLCKLMGRLLALLPPLIHGSLKLASKALADNCVTSLNPERRPA